MLVLMIEIQKRAMLELQSSLIAWPIIMENYGWILQRSDFKKIPTSRLRQPPR